VRNVFYYDSVSTSSGAVAPRRAAVLGRSGARSAASAPSAAAAATATGRLYANPASADAGPVHFLDAIIRISRIIEHQKSKSRLHCNIIGAVLSEQILKFRTATVSR